MKKHAKNESFKLTAPWYKYIVTLAVILMMVPVLRSLLYERSVDFIRFLVPYRQPWLTSIMQFYSFTFDGDYCVWFCGFLLVFGYPNDYIFLMICFQLNLHFINFLKTAIHDSRPQFDDLSIGVSNSGSCAAEFGNPSGHAILAAHAFLQASLLYKEGLARRFPKMKVGLIIDVLVVFNLFAISMCRLYLGRHSLDQILLGLVIGTVNAYFFHNELRPLIFRTI